jgi:hypothetical protein
MASGRLRLQQLCFFFDQQDFALDSLAVAPHPQDFVLELFHLPFVPQLALLVIGIPTPIQRRDQGRAVLHKSDNNCRQRGSDAKDSPLLLELDAAAEDGDVVLGGEEGNQAEGDAAEHLEQTQAIEAQPAAVWC